MHKTNLYKLIKILITNKNGRNQISNKNQFPHILF